MFHFDRYFAGERMSLAPSASAALIAMQMPQCPVQKLGCVGDWWISAAQKDLQSDGKAVVLVASLRTKASFGLYNGLATVVLTHPAYSLCIHTSSVKCECANPMAL